MQGSRKVLSLFVLVLALYRHDVTALPVTEVDDVSPSPTDVTPVADEELNEVETNAVREKEQESVLFEKKSPVPSSLSLNPDSFSDFAFPRFETENNTEEGNSTGETRRLRPVVITRVRVFALPILPIRAFSRSLNNDDVTNSTITSPAADTEETSASVTNCTISALDSNDPNFNSTSDVNSSNCNGDNNKPSLRNTLVNLFCHRSFFFGYTICQLFK